MIKNTKEVFKVILCIVCISVILATFSINCFVYYTDSMAFGNISIDHGLTSNSVNCIFTDENGIMWVGTKDGLNKYDGYQFVSYKNQPSDPKTISGNYIIDITKDNDDTYWVATLNGLNQFDTRKETFTRYQHNISQPYSLNSNNLTKLAVDKEGALWIATLDQGLNKYDKETGKFKHFTFHSNDNYSINDNCVNVVTVDHNGTLWVGTSKGLCRYDSDKDYFIRYPEFDEEEITCIYADKYGVLWIGTNYSGMYEFNTLNGKIQQFSSNPNDSENNPYETILCIFEDSEGFLWVGTFSNGLNRFERNNKVFLPCNSSIQNNLEQKCITAITEDKSGNIWIGVDKSGINILKKSSFHNFYTNKGSSHNIINTFYEDSTGDIWFGSDGGLNCLDKDSGTFNYYSNPDNKKPMGCVYSLYKDINKNLWIGTLGYGLWMYDTKAKKYEQYLNDPHNSSGLRSTDDVIFNICKGTDNKLLVSTVSGLNILDIHNKTFSYVNINNNEEYLVNITLTDHEGNIWVGTETIGLYKLNSQGEVLAHYGTNQENPLLIDTNNLYSINVLHEDQKGFIWIGTPNGLFRLNPNDITYNFYNEKDNMKSSNICGILEDKNSNLWISTKNGLLNYNSKTNIFDVYDIKDGLESAEFNLGAYLKTSSGEMFFGSNKGFVRFTPDDVKISTRKPEIVITRFQNPDNNLLFPGGPEDSQIKLSYNKNFFTADFTLTDYKNPSKNQYKYMLAGFDNEWNNSDTVNIAKYTNLKGGEYVFMVKGCNANGIWSDTNTSLRIFVQTPPWQTWWAYTGYSIGLIFLFALILIIKNKRHAKELEKERSIADKLRTLDRIKDEFMANTSHELKTPLHGIIGIAESLLGGATGTLPETTVKNLTMIVNSGKRLANLINDILDFSKLKNHEIEIHKKDVDIRQIAQIVLTVSKTLTGNKPVELVNEIPQNISHAIGDEERLQQILYNLVGNAIKFTEVGKVVVSAKELDGMVEVSVCDEGTGIEKEKLPYIFNSFEQGDSSTSREYGGTGLGLSITKKLVELHGGEIYAKSTLGFGSTFTFTLPISSMRKDTKALTSNHNKRTKNSIDTTYQEVAAVNDSSFQEGMPNILVVDDDIINQQILINQLSLEKYCVTVANNGIEALDIIEKQNFDLVLLDVMMPKMSGYEVVSKLREKYSLYSLPVILVTAKNKPEDIIVGFEKGANDYLQKPFNNQELRARASTWIELKKAAQFAITAEVYFLQAQIKPHFLYNALSTIMSFVRIEPEKARELLLELSNYLRESFNFKNMEQTMPIEREISYVKSYLYIEMARFSHKLKAEFDVDEGISSCTIPHLIIQPLVENAVKHGILPKKEGGTVKVHIKNHPECIILNVEDDGVGIENEKIPLLLEGKIKTTGNGIGLYNVNKRVKNINGEGVKVNSTVGKGTSISVVIPKKAS